MTSTDLVSAQACRDALTECMALGYSPRAEAAA